MADRPLSEIRNQPCRYKLKDMTKKVKPPSPSEQTVEGVRKVKKVIQKTDENGNPLFKTIKTERKKGCGCKGKKRETVIEEKRVPDTIEVWVEEPVQAPAPQPEQTAPVTEERQVLCKLYGTVPESYCQRCKTYKK